MCHFDFGPWSDATETDANDGRLDLESDGVRILRCGTVIYVDKGRQEIIFCSHSYKRNGGRGVFLYIFL